MSYTLSSDIIGAKEMAEAFSQAGPVISAALKQAIGSAAFSVEGKAKGHAPIQYGGLRNSIHTNGPQVTTNNVEATVGTDLPYAEYQEKGTGVYAGKGMITPKKAKVLAWKGKTGWVFARAVSGIKGKFFFKKAREEAQPELDKQLKEISDTVIDHLKK